MAGPLTIFLADDNLIVREGVRALLSMEPDFEIVGVAADYEELVAGAGATAPQVVVTDIRMPPNFEREGIDAAKEVRKLPPWHGRGDPVPVRRSGVRDLVARRGGRRVCRSAQRPSSRGRSTRPGDPRGVGRRAPRSIPRSSKHWSGPSAPTESWRLPTRICCDRSRKDDPSRR